METKPDRQGEWIKANPKAFELIVAPLIAQEMGIPDG